MTWDELVEIVIRRHPEVTSGTMFGMPCLKRGDGTVVVARWKGGGITVKLTDASSRDHALALPGTAPGSHAYDSSRPMRQWVHLPEAGAAEWQRLVDLAFMT